MNDRFFALFPLFLGACFPEAERALKAMLPFKVGFQDFTRSGFSIGKGNMLSRLRQAFFVVKLRRGAHSLYFQDVLGF